MGKVVGKMKKALEKYDQWCEELGLTPDKKRSCVPYKEEPSLKAKQKTQKKELD